jgi:hypothetical protein
MVWVYFQKRCVEGIHPFLRVKSKEHGFLKIEVSYKFAFTANFKNPCSLFVTLKPIPLWPSSCSRQ